MLVGDQRFPLLLPATAGLIGVAAYVAVLGWATPAAGFDVWAALLVAPLLVALTVPLARHIAVADRDPRLLHLLIAALVLKLVASLVRFAVAFEVYDGVADAAAYVEHGARLASWYREGVFGVDVQAKVPGTGVIRAVTGLVFAVIGPTTLGGFLVFSWLGFVGLLLFYRAFRLGCPDGDGRRYARVLFFLPSLLFWPSSIGKEAWMMATLGLCAYGAARLLNRHAGGLPLLTVGILGVALVRPHMAVLVCAGLTAAMAFRRARTAQSTGVAARVAGVTLLLLGGTVVLQQTEAYFGVEEQGVQGVDEVLNRTAVQTAQGGSSFDAVQARSPLQIPQAVFAVLFRPLPHEAHNAQALLASLEGAVLLGLFVVSWRRLRGALRVARRNPYVVFALVYALLFAVAFSSFGNFGILTRQRVQLFPFALTLLALPYMAPPPARWRAYN